MNVPLYEQGNSNQVYTRKGLLEIINAIPMAIALVDGQRRLILTNKALCLFLDRQELDLAGLAAGEALSCVNHDENPKGCGFGLECAECILNNTLKKTIDKGVSHFMVENKMNLKSGIEKYFRVSTHPLQFDDQFFAMLSIEDLTELKQQEQSRIQKEKLSAVLETVGAVCHEMNQPLMALMGYADLLLLDLEERDTNQVNLLEIKKHAERLGWLSKKLSRITQYRTKKYLSDDILDIDAAAEESINISITGTNHG